MSLALAKRVDSATMDELNAWYRVAQASDWRAFTDVRNRFPDVDRFGVVLIFNIRHNRYRLIVRVEFSKRLMFIKALLTHKEYDREEWKQWG